jgi:hypothetical protein
MKMQTANQLAGRAIGAMFFAVFGAIWLVLAFYALQMLRPATVSGLVLGLALLLSAAVSLSRRARHWPRGPDDPAVGRAFGKVNAAQWIAIAVVVLVLAWLHLSDYVMCAITAIVGLHMFPLARLFRYPPHYATGTLLVAWAVASAVIAPRNQVQGIAALGTGVILWLAAAIMLAVALQAVRQSPGAQTI